MIRTEIDSMPTELDEISRKIMQLEIEEAALRKESDKLSAERLEHTRKELAELREDFNAMKARWENEKESIQSVQRLKEEIGSINAQIEAAERAYDLEKLAELKYGKLPQAINELEKAEKESSDSKKNTLLRDRVTEDEIA